MRLAMALTLLACATAGEAEPVAVRLRIGKKPPDLRYWLVPGEVPAFARFEGAMYLNGPVWRLEQTTIDWPR